MEDFNLSTLYKMKRNKVARLQDAREHGDSRQEANLLKEITRIEAAIDNHESRMKPKPFR